MGIALFVVQRSVSNKLISGWLVSVSIRMLVGSKLKLTRKNKIN